MPGKTKPEKPEDEPRAFERFDSLFKRVVSASNKSVREQMDAEKRARKRRKHHR
jgi:hypothetical protein